MVQSELPNLIYQDWSSCLEIQIEHTETRHPDNLIQLRLVVYRIIFIDRDIYFLNQSYK